MKGSKIKCFFAFLLLLFALLLFYPYEITAVYPFLYPSGSLTWVAISFVIFTGVFVLFRNKKIRHLPKKIFLLTIIQLVGYLLSFLSQGKFGAFLYQLLLTAQYLLLLFCVFNTTGFIYFFKKYNIWILIMAVCGTIAWALTEFKGFGPLYFVVDQTDTERNLYNYILTFSVHDSTTTAMRYAGFFDEPGAMANWGLFALLINKLFVKSKKIEIPLIISLLFTFSMGFYAQLILYFLFFYTNKKNRGLGIALLIGIVLFVSVLKNIGETDENGIYYKSIGRIERILDEANDSNKVASLDSRSEVSSTALEAFLENPLFGSNKDEYLGDNIFEPLAMYGIIGSLFIYAPFFWLLISSIRRKDKQMLKVMIIIFVGFLHRPFHRTLLWAFVLYSIIAMYILYRGGDLINSKPRKPCPEEGK